MCFSMKHLLLGCTNKCAGYKANYNVSSSYDLYGDVADIQRFGRTGTGTFGLIDN